jgi:hypothetical protein
MRCPDDCGATITINLDPRTDKAWRFYRKNNQISIFPSVWRDTGCESHFIIWRHSIVWCDGATSDDEVIVEEEAELRGRIVPICSADWQHFTALAEKLGEVPWDVSKACRGLVRQTGLLVEGRGDLRGWFKRA